MLRNTFERHVDLSLMGEEGKRDYVLINGFTTFMFDHSLHRERKLFCCYCLQTFSSKEILRYHMITLKLLVNKELRRLKR